MGEVSLQVEESDLGQDQDQDSGENKYFDLKDLSIKKARQVIAWHLTSSNCDIKVGIIVRLPFLPSVVKYLKESEGQDVIVKLQRIDADFIFTILPCELKDISVHFRLRKIERY